MLPNHYVRHFFRSVGDFFNLKTVINVLKWSPTIKVFTITNCLIFPSPTSMWFRWISSLDFRQMSSTFHNFSSMKWIIIPEPKTMSPFTCSSKKLFANALSVDHGRFINKCASIGRFIRYKYRIMRINRS